MNGCYNRETLKTTVIVQEGWIMKEFTRLPKMIRIDDPLSKDCQYSKLTDDKKCEGCKWKSIIHKID